MSNPANGAQMRVLIVEDIPQILRVVRQGLEEEGFAVDTATGKLAPTGQVVETGSPSCIIFARA